MPRKNRPAKHYSSRGRPRNTCPGYFCKGHTAWQNGRCVQPCETRAASKDSGTVTDENNSAAESTHEYTRYPRDLYRLIPVCG